MFVPLKRNLKRAKTKLYNMQNSMKPTSCGKLRVMSRKNLQMHMLMLVPTLLSHINLNFLET